MLALNWGGVRFPWGSAPVLGLFGVSALFWLLFVLRLRSAPEPLIPGAILSNQVVATATIAACFGMGVFIGLTIYMPIYFQAVHGLSASHAALALIPLMAGTVTGATFSGRIMGHFKHYKRLPMLGICVSISFLSLLAYMPKELSLVQVSCLLGLSSLGLGTVLPVTTICIQNAVRQHQMGTATGTMNFFRQLGGAMIVAAFGAIVLSGLPPAATGAGVSMEMLASLVKANGADLSDTFRWVFAASAFGMGVTLTALLVMQERPLRTEISVDKIAGE
jgi:sugar phosphate permease